MNFITLYGFFNGAGVAPAVVVPAFVAVPENRYTLYGFSTGRFAGVIVASLATDYLL